MSEVINNNVFAEDKKFIDFSGLQYFWNKTKGYVDAADSRLSGQITINANAISSIQDELNSLSGGAGSIATQIDNKIAALDLPNTYEAKGEAAKAEAAAKAYADSLASNYDAAGSAAQALTDAKSYVSGLLTNYDEAGSADQALTDAKSYADGLNTAMDTRVKVLEAIDHDQLAKDAAASAVATILDDAPEAFDTLKEVAEWIADNDHADDVATLVTDVANLKAIDHDAYVAADEKVLEDAQAYVDGKVDGKFDAAGAAATAEQNAKDYADGKFQVAGSYEVEGAAAQALEDAKAYTDGKDTAMNTRVAALEGFDHSVYAKAADVYAKGEVDAAVEAAKNAAIADAATKLADYYTKTEVDNLLSTNSAADQAYAKTYTDQLFGSIKFAANSDIDVLFA